MNKLPHEIREMCDLAEEAADFLHWCIDDGPDGDAQLTLLDSHGNPWPIDAQEFAKWEQCIRNLKQIAMHSK